MKKMNDATQSARPLARVIARELSAEEVAQVAGATTPPSGGSCDTCGGNAGDNTTNGPEPTDMDVMK